ASSALRQPSVLNSVTLPCARSISRSAKSSRLAPSDPSPASETPTTNSTWCKSVSRMPRSLIVASSAKAEPPIPPMRNPNGAGTGFSPSASELARDMKLNHAGVDREARDRTIDLDERGGPFADHLDRQRAIFVQRAPFGRRGPRAGEQCASGQPNQSFVTHRVPRFKAMPNAESLLRAGREILVGSRQP